MRDVVKSAIAAYRAKLRKTRSAVKDVRKISLTARLKAARLGRMFAVADGATLRKTRTWTARVRAAKLDLKFALAEHAKHRQTSVKGRAAIRAYRAVMAVLNAAVEAAQKRLDEVAPECPVCYNKRVNRELSCGHKFCKTCVASWRSERRAAYRKLNCPNCRARITKVWRLGAEVE